MGLSICRSIVDAHGGIRMPGMSGLELQQRLNDKRAIVPVIVITGHGDVSLAIKAMKGGAVDFLQKPFDQQELLDRVHKNVASALGVSQRTVEVHRARVMEKTEPSSLAHLVRMSLLARD